MSTQRILETQEAGETEALTDAAQLEGEEEAALSEEQVENVRAARRAAMDEMGASLMGLLSEAVQFRGPYEREWIDDIRQFEHGDPLSNGVMTITKENSAETDEYLSVTDNITRPATTTFAARISDMIFPTNDRNWDIDHTPKPELPPEIMESIMAGPDGNGLPDGIDPEELVLTVARKRVSKMRTQIDDQLQESSYADHGREVIMDACKLGHGVLKGPFAKASKRRRYKAGEGYKAAVEVIMTDPKVCRVDPWMIYPRPCRRIEDCPGVFEMHEMTAKRVSDLRIQPGFSSEQLGRLLKQTPVWDSITSTQSTMRAIEDRNFVVRNDTFAVFEYNGEMPKEAMVIFIAQLMSESKMDGEQSNEILSFVEESNALHLTCNVWFSQGIVIKVAINPVDTDCGMYKFFVFEERENAPFGKGVPRLLRDPQRSVRILWASIMLNATMSSSPQIGVRKGALIPAGPAGGVTDMRCTRPRVWAFSDEVEDIEKALQVFIVPNVINGILPVYERAKKNGEEQVMLPAIAQGEPSSAVPTSSGLAMLLNAGNIVQRRLAARYDSAITSPTIEGFYDWNMEYGDEEAKGDYKIVARASSHLLVKDVQAQHFLTALNMYSSNPVLAPRMKIEEWAEEGLRIMDLNASRFLKSEEEMAAEAESTPPPPDADAIKAQAAMATAEARTLEAKANAEVAVGRLALEREDRALDYEDRIADRESREKIAAMQVQEAIAGLDADAQARVMELQAEMQKEADRNATQTRIAGMRAAEKAQEIASRERQDQLEVKVESAPRLA